MKKIFDTTDKLKSLYNEKLKPNSPKNETVEENPKESNTNYFLKNPVQNDEGSGIYITKIPVLTRPMGILIQHFKISEKWQNFRRRIFYKTKNYPNPNLDRKNPKPSKNKPVEKNPIPDPKFVKFHKIGEKKQESSENEAVDQNTIVKVKVFSIMEFTFMKPNHFSKFYYRKFVNWIKNHIRVSEVKEESKENEPSEEDFTDEFD